jgi:hypothetical protein
MLYLLRPRCEHGTWLIGRHELQGVSSRRQAKYLPTGRPERVEAFELTWHPTVLSLNT